jgi:arylsulfatase A-like enzyme
MDDAIGRTLAAIRQHELEQDTLVIFVNDNGGPTMPTTTVNGSRNDPLRGSKRTTWEGGIRVPLIIKWPGHVPAGKIDRRPVIQLDIFPTVLAATGASTTPTSAIDGVNLLPYVTGKNAGAPHDALYWRLGGMMAIRAGDWKLVKSRMGPFVDRDPAALGDLSGAELFNLVEDIGESKDLAASRADKVKELREKWQRWNQRLAMPAWGAGRGGGFLN